MPWAKQMCFREEKERKWDSCKRPGGGIPLNEKSHIEIAVSMFPSTRPLLSILSALLNSDSNFRKDLQREKLRQEMLRSPW